MKRFRVLLAVLAVTLVFGLTLVGCATTSTTGVTNTNTTANTTATTTDVDKFEGTWVHGNPQSGPAQFTFTGNAFTYTGQGGPISGTFTYDNKNITFTASNGDIWNTTYTLTRTSVRFEQGTGWKAWYGQFNKKR